MSRPRSRLRGALVGYGFIAESGHVPAYRSLSPESSPLSGGEGAGPFDVVAVADPCAERRRAAAKALPNARIYEDHATLFAAEAGKIDYVDICAPPYVHAPIAHAALDQGLHVLCEKPLTPSTAEARALADHARRVRRVLYPCHNYKHAPVIQAVRRVLDDGAIGPIHLVTLDTFRNTHARGVPEWRENWRREKKYSGGGIAMDHGSHTFYLAFDWLRSYPTSITAKVSTLLPSDTEDTVACTVTFPTGLAVAQLTWTAGMRRVLYTLHGAKGAVRVEDDEVQVSVMTQAKDGAPRSNIGGAAWTVHTEVQKSDWLNSGHAPWFASLFGEFATAVANNDFVSRATRDSLRCIELINAAYASSNEGCREMPLGVPDRQEPRREPPRD